MSVAFKEYSWIFQESRMHHEANPHTRGFEEIKLGSETDLKPGSLET